MADSLDKVESDATPTSEQFVRVFDLHVEVLRANRSLDSAFPPYTGEDFQAIYDRAQSLRERTTALIEHLDQMRMAPARHPYPNGHTHPSFVGCHEAVPPCPKRVIPPATTDGGAA